MHVITLYLRSKNLSSKEMKGDRVYRRLSSRGKISAGIGTILIYKNQLVAGFHRASPSTTLDKRFIQFTRFFQLLIILQLVRKKKKDILDDDRYFTIRKKIAVI
jgi:hypothetical protein